METGGFDMTPLEDKENARSKQERNMMSGEEDDDDGTDCTWWIFGFAVHVLVGGWGGTATRPEMLDLGAAAADPSP